MRLQNDTIDECNHRVLALTNRLDEREAMGDQYKVKLQFMVEYKLN